MKKTVSQSKAVCPLTKAAELLSDTWTILIIRALSESPKRFTELHQWLQHISTRTLTIKLKKLQSIGLIDKDIDGVYVTTAKGKGLQKVEQAMIAYSNEYLAD